MVGDRGIFESMVGSRLSTGPLVAYVDTCIPSGFVNGDLSSNDSRVMGRIEALVQSSQLTLWTSTVMLEEMQGDPRSVSRPSPGGVP